MDKITPHTKLEHGEAAARCAAAERERHEHVLERMGLRWAYTDQPDMRHVLRDGHGTPIAYLVGGDSASVGPLLALCPEMLDVIQCVADIDRHADVQNAIRDAQRLLAKLEGGAA